MVYLLFSICFILGLFFRKNKFIQVIMIVYIYIIMAFNINNPDYTNYSSGYYFIGIGEYTGWIKDYGYLFLVEIANKVGLDYSEFLIVFFAVCTVLLVKIVNLYSSSPNAVLSMLMLYPLFINIIQIRLFLAILIVLFAIQYLNEYKFSNLLKYLFALVLATSLHLSAVFFSCLMMLYIRKKIYFLVLLFTILLVGILFFPVILNVINSFTEGKLDGYMESNYITFNKTLRVTFFGVSIIIFSLYLKRCLSSLPSSFQINSYDILLSRAVLMVLPISVVAIMFSNEFERFSRIGYIIIYILFFNLINSGKIKIISKFFACILFIFSVFSYIYFQYYFRFSNEIPFSEAVFETILEHNSLIGVYDGK